VKGKRQPEDMKNFYLRTVKGQNVDDSCTNQREVNSPLVWDPKKVPSGGKIKTFPVRELGLLERCRRRALYDSLHPASRQVSLDVTMAHKAGSDLTSSRGIACSLRKCSGHSCIDPSQGLHQKATCNNGLLPRWGTRLLVATVAAMMGGPDVTSNQVCGVIRYNREWENRHDYETYRNWGASNLQHRVRDSREAQM